MPSKSLARWDGVKHTLVEVADLWECIQQWYGVEVHAQMSYGATPWPAGCQLLYTVYTFRTGEIEIAFTQERAFNDLMRFVGASEMWQDLLMIEGKLDASPSLWGKDCPASKLIKAGEEIFSFGVMMRWWREGGRGEAL